MLAHTSVKIMNKHEQYKVHRAQLIVLGKLSTRLYKYKSKKPIGLKKEYIGSTAQKKANKITKLLIKSFFMSVKATFHKNVLIKNLVIFICLLLCR